MIQIDDQDDQEVEVGVEEERDGFFRGGGVPVLV